MAWFAWFVIVWCICAVGCALATAYFEGHDTGWHKGFGAGWRSWLDTPPVPPALYPEAEIHAAYARGHDGGMIDALEMGNAVNAGETLTPNAQAQFDAAMACVDNNPAPGAGYVTLELLRRRP